MLAFPRYLTSTFVNLNRKHRTVLVHQMTKRAKSSAESDSGTSVATKKRAKKTPTGDGKTNIKEKVVEVNDDGKVRCGWSVKELDVIYHDEEWGVPCSDDRHLFEMLTLEGAQAGLNWSTILAKRNNYREAFNNFDIVKVSKYKEKKILQLLDNPGIVRNKLKVRSTVKNAQVVLAIQEEFGSFSNYLWTIVNSTRSDEFAGQDSRMPIVNPGTERIISTPVSDALSKDLKKRGCSFVGTTIMYAYMQAVGLVNDHDENCFRRNEILHNMVDEENLTACVTLTTQD